MNNNNEEYYCQCICGEMSGIVETKQDAEDWYEYHVENQNSESGLYHKPHYGNFED